MLNRRRVLPHSGDFFSPLFFFVTTNWYCLLVCFPIVFTSKDYEHLFKKKKLKTKKRRK